MTSDNAAPPGNLPAEPNSFIGRERDLAELVAILGRVRALTLCGPGGIGKTRLALRLAAMLAASYPDGVWIVDLADVEVAARWPGRARRGLRTTSRQAAASDPALNGRLVPLVTAALGIRGEPERLLADTLAEALRPRSALLILDTCEHLVQACAELVQRLLAGLPGTAGDRDQPRAARGARRDHLAGPAARACRPRPATTRPPPASATRRCTRRCSCSWNGPQPSGRASRSTSRTWPRSPTSAARWTACRWPSSSRPPGSGRCLPSRSAAGWPTDSSCSRWATGPRRRASRRCAPPWSGATTCSPRPSGCCSAGCPSSTAGAWRWPSGSARTSSCPPARYSTCSGR